MITIAAVGDIYIEKYLWPAREENLDTMPYTAPEELRHREPTNTTMEIAGSPLHVEIYGEFLRQCGFEKTEISPTGEVIGASKDFCVIGPGSAENLEQLAQEHHVPIDSPHSPFPVFLHELGPCAKPNIGPDRGTDVSKRDYVWRITKSHGEIRPLDWEQAQKKSAEGIITVLSEKTVEWLSSLSTETRTPGPMVVVVCDRNAAKGGIKYSAARDLFQDERIRDAANKLFEKNKGDLLIIWHTRWPLFDEANGLSRFFEQTAYSVTVPIVSDACLREAGVPLRFDVAFESTVRDFLGACGANSVLKKLFKFPHVLVRFDYGLMHLTSENGELVGLDIHSFAARDACKGKGHVHGMTPLLVAAILREVIAFSKKNETEAAPVAKFLEQSKKFKHPTILYNSPLDRAIDFALLLWHRNYKYGFGNGDAGAIFRDYSDKRLSILADELKKEVVASHSPGGLFEEIRNEIGKISQPNPEFEDLLSGESLSLHWSARSIAGEGNVGHPMTELTDFVIVNAKSNCPYLTRFSVNHVPHLVERTRGNGSADIVDEVSRTKLLQDARVMSAAAGLSDLKGKTDLAPAAVRDIVLARAVRHGLEFVLQRPDFDRRALDEAKRAAGTTSATPARPSEQDATFRFEPSVTCPSEKFRSLTTVIPRDIDSFLSLYYLVRKYFEDKDWEAPLSLAVFGKPGSGKNHTIETVLGSVEGCVFDPSLKCNLAQWAGTRSLTNHFHKIQDRTLHAEKPPIVLFDEFDSALDGGLLGWLKYFLMPMQDGLYMVGNDTFHIGRAIFVFSGGTAQSFEQFNALVKDSSRDAKAIDFISRLRGYIDVQDFMLTQESDDGTSVARHVAQIQRAVVLRGLLKKHMKNIFDKAELVADIDHSLISAFMNISEFKHGIRSMEAIIQMSRMSSGITSYRSSALPPKDQLALHVDADEFMRLVRDYSDPVEG